MREHAHLPAMVRFMGNHVAQHFDASRPRLGPSVSEKLFDMTFAVAERFREHLCAASGALGQGRAGLPRRAVRAVELGWNFQMRSCKPDPLGADIVHVREDPRDRARIAGRFGIPGCRVKLFDQNLVHSIVGNKDPDGGLAEWPVDFVADLDLTRGQDSFSLTDQNTSPPSATRKESLHPSHEAFRSDRQFRSTISRSGDRTHTFTESDAGQAFSQRIGAERDLVAILEKRAHFAGW
jgi:hypothetical protein